MDKKSLAGYSSCGHKQLDITEWLSITYVLYVISSQIFFNEKSSYLADGYILAGIIKFVISIC